MAQVTQQCQDMTAKISVSSVFDGDRAPQSKVLVSKIRLLIPCRSYGRDGWNVWVSISSLT